MHPVDHCSWLHPLAAPTAPQRTQERHPPSPRPIYPPNIPCEECEHLPPKPPLPTQPGSSQRFVCIYHSTVFRQLRHLKLGEKHAHEKPHRGSAKRTPVFAKCSPALSHLKALKFSYQPPTKDKNIFPGKNIPEPLPVKASISDFALTASTYREDAQRGQGGEPPDSPRKSPSHYLGV